MERKVQFKDIAGKNLLLFNPLNKPLHLYTPSKLIFAKMLSPKTVDKFVGNMVFCCNESPYPPAFYDLHKKCAGYFIIKKQQLMNISKILYDI